MSVFVYSVRLAKKGCQNKVRCKQFTEEKRQTDERERQGGKRQKGKNM